MDPQYVLYGLQVSLKLTIPQQGWVGLLSTNITQAEVSQAY